MKYCSPCFLHVHVYSNRKANIGLFPLKICVFGFHHNTALIFLASRTCLISEDHSNFYRVIAIFSEQCIILLCYVHVLYNVMCFTMYMYFTQLHHHVSDSAMSMARTWTALTFWMSLKNVMLWREGERTRWMQWFVQWYATGLLSMVIIFTSLSCHQS